MSRAFAARGPGDLSCVFALVFSSTAATVHGLHGFFQSRGFIIGRNLTIVLAVVFWLGLAFWVHKDARRRISDGFLVFLASLLGLVPPYLGPIVYLLFRPAETIADVHSRQVELQALEQQLGHAQPACPVCRSPVELDYVACPVCMTMLREPCARCNAPLEPLWQMCPYCAAPVVASPPQVDLDAALTAEAKTITLVDDTIPLVPQAEQHVADA